jgi:hypothetical protein
MVNVEPLNVKPNAPAVSVCAQYDIIPGIALAQVEVSVAANLAINKVCEPIDSLNSVDGVTAAILSPYAVIPVNLKCLRLLLVNKLPLQRI